MVSLPSPQQKKALILCGVIMAVLGGAITICGFIFDFHGVYNRITDARPANVHHVMFPHTQYWLGMPLLLLAFYVLTTVFYRSSILHIIGLTLCCFLMVASLCAVGLHSTIWYVSLNLAHIVYSLQCTDQMYGQDARCTCKREHHYDDDDGIDEYESMLSLMSCSEVKHFPAIVSGLVILSALAYLACQATCFMYVKTLRWLDLGHCNGGVLHETTSSQILMNEQSM